MALTIPCSTTRAATLEEYVDYVGAKVDLKNLDSLAESAPMLRALANDRNLVVRELNTRIENAMAGTRDPSVQTLILGKGEGFYVRANIWPAMADLAGRAYQDQTAYNLAHDHNFTFLTACYAGPGYESEIYEYDYHKVDGFVGEPVELRFLEKVTFGAGAVMLYRESRDVHIQYAPTELTITLNLMVQSEAMHDQYHFDLARRVITSGLDAQAAARTSLMALAGYLGDANSTGLLEDLAKRHPCRRTRLAAYEAICRQQPQAAASTWEKACGDPSALVAKTARQKLRELQAA
jgi:hypothetical protein